MEKYLSLLATTIEQGYETPPARGFMPNTIVNPNQSVTFDMNDGIPLLTTKEVHIKSVIAEVLWIIKGKQNIKYLLDNKCNVWNQNAYKWYLEKMDTIVGITPVSMKAMLRAVRDEVSFICVHRGVIQMFKDDSWFSIEIDAFENGNMTPLKRNNGTIMEFADVAKAADIVMRNRRYKVGDMGAVYGPQWRNYGGDASIGIGGIDQLGTMLYNMTKNPFSRYHKIVAWNPKDMPNLNVCGQPNCHGDMQITCYPFNGKVYFEMKMDQRSGDLFLGVPFNWLFYSIIGSIIEEYTGCIFTKFNWTCGNMHIYNNHIEACYKQLSRQPIDMKHEVMLKKPIKTLNDIMLLEVDDIIVIDQHGDEVYHNHGKIKADLSVGLKK